MEVSRSWTGILLTLFVISFSCDEQFDFPENSLGSAEEDLMVGDWAYQHVFIDSDTLIVLGQDTVSTGYTQDFNVDGEPVIDTERQTDIRRSYLRYGQDHSYELFSEVNDQSFGSYENYQPNYGFWDIEKSADSTILVHNKLLDYQKRYEIITLTQDSLVRRLIGPRVVYFWDEPISGFYASFTAHTWIETFIRKKE